MSDQRRQPQAAVLGFAVSVEDWRLLDRIYSSSPAAFEQLLEPDRAGGLLRDHDYDALRKEMRWSNRIIRRYQAPLTVFFGLNAGIFAYNRRNTFFRRIHPRWRWAPAVAVGGAAFMLSVVDGFFMEYTFHKRLEDPMGVRQAMQNVRVRSLRSVQSDESTMEEKWDNNDDMTDGRATASSASSPSYPRQPRNTEEPETPFAETNSNSSFPTPSQQPQPQSTQPPSAKSQWDEIRAAHSARHASKTSSWDVIRENHERERVSSGSDSSPPPSSYPDSAARERAEEQARFDALLEAERRRASS